ncbi:MAG: hypothetical protein AMS20_12790, partial [Gemmatimonas sp. SG8_28]
MTRLFFGALAVVSLASPAGGEAQTGGRPLQVDEFLTLDRVSDPQVSPDGRWIAYAVTTTDLGANGRSTDLWLLAVGGGEPRRISDVRRGGRHARWSPDGATIAYITTRADAGEVRLYDVARGRSRRLALLSTGADGVIWSPTGSHLAFVSEV